MTTDLDALEAQIKGAYDLCHVNAQDITDLIAELRQERAKVRGLGFSLEGTQAALSRAEETIDRFRTLEPLWHHGMYGCPQDMYGANQIRTILTEYGKQKGADRG